MNVKRYFSALLITLALFGLGHQQVSVPNQEIIVQFAQDKVDSVNAQNTIDIVKIQLKSIGAENIQVIEEKNGKLKITYYSEREVESIKAILSNEKSLKLAYSSKNEEIPDLPSNEDSNSYNFDVFEIKKSVDSEWGFEGTLVIELKPEGDRFSNPKYFASQQVVNNEQQSLKVTCKAISNIATAINNTSYKIPEVRAGPIA